MISLQKEAEEFANMIQDPELFSEMEYKNDVYAFHAGATSKYVEAEKIKFAIEQLHGIRTFLSTISEIDGEKISTTYIRLETILIGKGKELEQQLKQLENEH